MRQSLPAPDPVIVSYCPSNWAVAVIDQALQSCSPIRELPVCHRINVPFINPREDTGMAGDDEVETLNVIADAVDGFIEEVGGTFAVRDTRDSVRTFYFYAPEVDTGPAFRKHIDRFPGYEITMQSLEDPEWTVYRGYLPLIELDRQAKLGEALVERLKAEGDDPSKGRMIDHALGFRDTAGREKFAAWAKGADFEVVGEKRADGEFAYRLDLRREGTLDSSFFRHLMYHVLVKLAETRGVYLGNGCFVPGIKAK
jgi:hypothetical protein